MPVFNRHPIGPKPRRTRRQSVAIIVAVLVVVILIAEVINDAVKDSPQVARRANASWAAGVEPLLATSSAMGKAIRSIDASRSGVSRATLDATVATLTSVTQANLTDFVNLGIAAPSSEARSLANKVFIARRNAAVDLRQSVSLATSPSAVEQSAVTLCAAEQAAIRSGDGALGSLDRMLQATPGILHLRFAKWSTYATPLGEGGCTSLVGSLRANNALTLRSTLRLVAISLLPTPVQINGVPNPTTTTTSTTSTTLPVTTSTTTLGGGFQTTTSTSSTTTSTSTTILATTTTLQIPPQASHSVLPPTNTVTADVVLEDVGTAPAKSVSLTVSVLTNGHQVVATQIQSLSLLGASSSHYFSLGPLDLGKIRGTFVLQVSATATGTSSARSSITLVRSS